MNNHSPAWPHGDLEKIFDNIYVIRGTNVTHFDGTEIQHSRNMTIINNQGNLTLINTVRLDDDGLKQLTELGNIKHVLRIGAFHGRDDAFYMDTFKAEFWAFNSAEKPKSHMTTHVLSQGTALPLKGCELYQFADASPEEGFIHSTEQGGIIITCDSIKNWIEVDKYFSETSGKNYQESGEIAKARISPIWLEATGVKKSGFDTLLSLEFKHLISAHGDILRDTAYQDVLKSIGKIQ